jgi:hypothetical protein
MLLAEDLSLFSFLPRTTLIIKKGGGKNIWLGDLPNEIAKLLNDIIAILSDQATKRAFAPVHDGSIYSEISD